MPRIPSDPYDPDRPVMSEYDADREARLEREGQIDPELTEGPASTSRFVLYAVAAALILGAVFYGLNNSSIHEASTAPPTQTAQTKPADPNSQPGMTTGSATNRDRAGNPTAGQTNDNR